MTQNQNVTWISEKVTRTNKRNINDIFCMGCRAKLGKVDEYRYIYLNGWDRQAVIDLEKGTVTVKCKCGVGRVIRNRGNHEEGYKENLGVWLEEINSELGGEREDSDQGEGNAD